MTAVRKNLAVEQGTTFVFGMTLEELDVDGTTVIGPMDLTGWTGAMQIREAQGSTVIWEGTTDNGKMVFGRLSYDADPLADDPANGRLMVIISDEDSDEWTTKKAKYDLEIKRETPRTVIRLCQGSVGTDPNITQHVTGDAGGANDAVIA